jgi:transposase
MINIGIDWSETHHDICFMNDAGAVVTRVTVPHSPDGFLKLETTRQQLGVTANECRVGLETAHNLLIDFLWAKGYSQVYVIPPSVVKGTRGRYRQSGARTDESDALLLADVLRTDRGRFQPWHPDDALTRQMRVKVSLHAYLTQQTTRFSNRLRAVLVRYYPAATQVFSGLKTQIALHFVQEFPTPQAAAALSFTQFRAFAKAHGYTRRAELPVCFARLQQAQPEADPTTIAVYQDEAVALAAVLLNLVQTQLAVARDLVTQFELHPDYPIFHSLPGAGAFLGPALLVKFGNDRARFPMPASVQALAGTCPVTDHSGKRRIIKFRQSCDREFRRIAQQWAIASLAESAWAQSYWQQARPHCQSDSHAFRCLANRWLAIAWKLWQARVPYDEDYHLQQRAAHSKPRA